MSLFKSSKPATPMMPSFASGHAHIARDAVYRAQVSAVIAQSALAWVTRQAVHALQEEGLDAAGIAEVIGIEEDEVLELLAELAQDHGRPFARASEDSAKELTETCAIVRAAWGIPRT